MDVSFHTVGHYSKALMKPLDCEGQNEFVISWRSDLQHLFLHLFSHQAPPAHTSSATIE